MIPGCIGNDEMKGFSQGTFAHAEAIHQFLIRRKRVTRLEDTVKNGFAYLINDVLRNFIGLRAFKHRPSLMNGFHPNANGYKLCDGEKRTLVSWA